MAGVLGLAEPVRTTPREHGFHTAGVEIFRPDQGDLERVAGVTPQVDGLVGRFRRVVDRRPSRMPQRRVGALGPRVLDEATEEGHESGHREGAETETGGADDHLATTQGGRCAGVLEQTDDRLLVDLGRSTVVTILNRDLGRDELLGDEDQRDADGEHRQTERHAEERRVERVPPVVRIVREGEFPVVEQEDPEAREGGHAGHGEPDGHLTLGPLLDLGARHRVTLGPVDDLDAVEIGTEFDELIGAHLFEFVPRRDVFVVRAHARDPIHMAPATMAMTPTNHMTMPSLTGPKPPIPSPPLGFASVTYLT